jgi:translation initiation factor IF-3
MKSPITLLLLSLIGCNAFQSKMPFLSHERLAFTTLDMARRVGPNRGGRAPPVKEKAPPMNMEIEDRELRVVTPNPKGKDEPLGVMSRDEALAKAKAMGDLDLILVNGSSDPPVCKIVDYSKYRYEQLKKQKEVKKNSKVSEVKEVKMSYKIDIHDYDVRMRMAAKFLKQGNRVKCTVQFRGREVQHDNLGFDLLDKLALDLDKMCVKEGRAKREGRNLSLIIGPRPEVLKKLNEEKRARDKIKKKARQESFQVKKVAGEFEDSLQEQTALALEKLMEGDDDDEDSFDDDEDDDEDDDDDDLQLDELLGGGDDFDNLFS